MFVQLPNGTVKRINPPDAKYLRSQNGEKKFESELPTMFISLRSSVQYIYICLVKLLISANLFVQGGGKVYSLSRGINISFVNLIANYEACWNDKDAWPLQTIDKYRLLTARVFVCSLSAIDQLLYYYKIVYVSTRERNSFVLE